MFNKEKFLFTRKEVQFSGFCEVKELVEDIRWWRTTLLSYSRSPSRFSWTMLQESSRTSETRGCYVYRNRRWPGNFTRYTHLAWCTCLPDLLRWMVTSVTTAGASPPTQWSSSKLQAVKPDREWGRPGREGQEGDSVQGEQLGVVITEKRNRCRENWLWLKDSLMCIWAMSISM